MHPSLTRLSLPGADVFYLERPELPASPAAIFDQLEHGIPWKQESITIHGRSIPQPRLTSWHGEPDAAYTYSGLKMTQEPWTPLLLQLKAICDGLCEADFNSVLCNAYRTERSSIGFHSDNEPELGRRPTIASLSFGEEREFILKPRFRKDIPEMRIPLASGSLLVMAGDTQRNWLHGIQKERQPKGPRINLTFRQVVRR